MKSDADVAERIERNTKTRDGRALLAARLSEIAAGLRDGPVPIAGLGALVPAEAKGKRSVGYQPDYDFLTALTNRWLFDPKAKRRTSVYKKLDDVFTAIAQLLSEGPQNYEKE